MSKHMPTPKPPKRAKCRECERLQLSCDRDSMQIAQLFRESEVFIRFFQDVDLILATSCDTLCGSKWINAAALLEARNRYAKAMEEIQ